MGGERREQNTAEPAATGRWQAIYIGAILLVSLPYAISFASQLCSDDFILLYYYGTRPLWKIWTVFSPHTIWTYHPLQHSYFVIGWHISGIEPWAYRAMSLAVHLGTALLLMKFGRDLSGSIHLGGWAAIVFAGYWRQWEAIIWAASIATPESVLFTILTCVAFLRFLRRRRPAAYAAMMFAIVGWCFSKETIIQMPLLLVAVYCCWWWDKGKTEVGAGVKVRRDLVRLLVAPVAMVAIYLILYALFVRNVYSFAKLGYERAPVKIWPLNVITWLDYALNPLVGNEIVNALRGARLMHLIAHWHVVSAATLLLVVYFAFLRQRRLPLFALSMMLVGMIPYAALPYGYFGSRYYYSVILGGSLLAAALARELWRLTTGKRGGWHSWLRIAVAATAGLWVVASFLQLANIALHDRHVTRVPRELYDFFASQTDKADRPVLFVVDTRPVKDEVDVELGWGLLECARLALRSDKVAAVELGYDLEPHVLKEFNGYRERYLVLKTEDGRWTSRLADGIPLAAAPDRPKGSRP